MEKTKEDCMLLLRFSNYKKYDFIEEHMKLIKNEGYVWLMKAGRRLPQDKIAELYRNGGTLILRGSKSAGAKFYKLTVEEYMDGRITKDFSYPEYYEEMITDDSFWFMESLTGSWFKIISIVEMNDEEKQQLVLVSNGKKAEDVLNKSMSSILYVKYDIEAKKGCDIHGDK